MPFELYGYRFRIDTPRTSKKQRGRIQQRKAKRKRK